MTSVLIRNFGRMNMYCISSCRVAFSKRFHQQPAHDNLTHDSNMNSVIHLSHANTSLSTQSLFSAADKIPVSAPSHEPLSSLIKEIKDPRNTKSSAVLDPRAKNVLIGDPEPEISRPPILDDTANKKPEIQARHIQKLRRYKMKLHKRKRHAKRMKFVYAKLDLLRARRAENRLNREVNQLRTDAQTFDAMKFIESRLERAHHGGFTHDFWKSPSEQPDTTWEKYAPIPRRLSEHEMSDDYKRLKDRLNIEADPQMKRRFMKLLKATPKKGQ